MATNRERFGKRLPGLRQQEIIGLLVAAHESGFPGLPLESIIQATRNKYAWRSIAALMRIGVLHFCEGTRIGIVDPPAEVLEPQPGVIDFFVLENRRRRRRLQQHSNAPHAA